jgi:hypothetical protein
MEEAAVTKVGMETYDKLSIIRETLNVLTKVDLVDLVLHLSSNDLTDANYKLIALFMANKQTARDSIVLDSNSISGHIQSNMDAENIQTIGTATLSKELSTSLLVSQNIGGRSKPNRVCKPFDMSKLVSPLY